MTQELWNDMQGWREEVNAQYPAKNPDFIEKNSSLQ
jgi:hypothetical protein